MTTKKITKREHFNRLLAMPDVANDPEAVEFINHEIELLNRKNSGTSGEKKLTPTQQANMVLKDAILAGMEPNHLYAVTEISKVIPECNGLPTQKITPLLTQLVEVGKVENVKDGRKSYYRIVVAD